MVNYKKSKLFGHFNAILDSSSNLMPVMSYMSWKKSMTLNFGDLSDDKALFWNGYCEYWMLATGAVCS